VADDTGSPRAWPKARHLAIGGGSVVILAFLFLFVLLTLRSCPQGPPSSYAQAGYDPYQQSGPCPRPSPSPAPPALGGQESEVRELRRRAFAGDFFAQIELAHRYEGQRSVDQNLKDPVESSVWYAIALSNSDGWSGVDRPVAGPTEPQPFWTSVMFWRQDPQAYYSQQPLSCRDRERQDAYNRLDYLASDLTGPDREKVRDRVIYVLSTEGARGFLTLSRMYDRRYATFGEPWSDPVASTVNVINTSAIFVRSDADAWLYNYLAAGTGDIGGYVALSQFEQMYPDKADNLAAAANRWTPPFEFYPPEPPENKPGAVQYSDESRPADGADEYALREFTDVPFIHVGRALEYLQVARPAPASAAALDPHSVAAFHELIGEPARGPFSLLDAVRAIQLAAVRGSVDAQLVLAVMYSEGIGVRADYARALKWFEAAAHQGSPAAQFAVSTYFALGAEGVADQDKAAAVAARLSSAVEGFHPSAERMRDLLAHICRTHRVDRPERDRRNG
jgi:TPR repeat protein